MRNSLLKIAIIGSGISGLTCAHYLKSHHDITIFEKEDWIGGHTCTLNVDFDSEQQAIDIGFIVYNERTYPNFIRLLQELQVLTHETSMGFSMRCHATDFEYSGNSLAGLLAQKRNLLRPRFYRMVLDILRFYRETNDYIQKQPEGTTDAMTVLEFARLKKYSDAFVEYHLLPMGAAIWSCAEGTFGDFPFRFVAEFYHNHGLIQIGNRPAWRVITNGSRSYVDALTASLSQQIRLNSSVESIARNADGVVVQTAQGMEQFEHVILACHSDQALRLVNAPDTIEAELLRAIPYTRNSVVLHTDESLLPKSRRAWASWNYGLYPDRRDRPTLTYNMNILQGIQSRHTYCVTLNADDKIDPDKILATYHFDHPIFTLARQQAQSRHAEMIARNGISYCGAYWRNGFHEDGVVSALRVCQKLGVEVPIMASHNP
jgi:predicted NAD/FAD-binding protein